MVVVASNDTKYFDNKLQEMGLDKIMINKKEITLDTHVTQRLQKEDRLEYVT